MCQLLDQANGRFLSRGAVIAQKRVFQSGWFDSSGFDELFLDGIDFSRTITIG